MFGKGNMIAHLVDIAQILNRILFIVAVEVSGCGCDQLLIDGNPCLYPAFEMSEADFRIGRIGINHLSALPAAEGFDECLRAFKVIKRYQRFNIVFK